MPIATPEIYADMLDRAKSGSFAYPAINITSSQTVTAAIRGFAEAGSDGIIQVSTGGGEYASGSTIKDMVTGAKALAAYAEEVAKNYPVNIALHTDHCPKDKARRVRPSAPRGERRAGQGRWAPDLPEPHVGRLGRAARGEPPDRRGGSSRRARRPTSSSRSRSASSVARRTVSPTRSTSRLYTTPEDAIATVKALGAGEKGRYLTALTFGNVHGVYKPGNVACAPRSSSPRRRPPPVRLGLGADGRPFDLVFHGGSGSTAEEIAAAVDYGVVKMNVDTDTQYAFTRPVAEWMLRNFDGVLKIDGEVGNKKQYDPRAWGKEAEAAMARRVIEACENLRSAGTHQA